MAQTVRLRPSTAAMQEILRIRTTCGALHSGHTPGQLPDPQLLPFSVKGSSLDPETQERSCEHVRAVGGAGFQTVSCPPHPRAWGRRPLGQSHAPHPPGVWEQTLGTSCAPNPSLMAVKVGPHRGGPPAWSGGHAMAHAGAVRRVIRAACRPLRKAGPPRLGQ